MAAQKAILFTNVQQESRTVAGKPRDAAANFDPYGVRRQLLVSYFEQQFTWLRLRAKVY